MSTTINGTTGVTFPDASVQATAATGFGFKNRIINGAMVIDQRNAGASVTPTSTNTYTLDRWNTILGAASKFSVQQSTNAPVGFSNSMKVTSLSAYSLSAGDYFTVAQYVEANNFSDSAYGTANAKTYTVSFWVYSSLTGTFSGSLMNNAADRSYNFTYTINSANTWEQKTVTFLGDTSGTWVTSGTSIGIRVYFNLGVSTTYGSGATGSWYAGLGLGTSSSVSIVSTNAATLYITGVQLEKGSTATSFDYRPYGTELALCQRYYEVVGSVAGGEIVIGGYSGGTTNGYVDFPFATVKRTAATVTKNGTWTTFNASQPVVGSASTWGFRAYVPSSGSGNFFVQNDASGCNFTASSEL